MSALPSVDNLEEIATAFERSDVWTIYELLKVIFVTHFFFTLLLITISSFFLFLLLFFFSCILQFPLRNSHLLRSPAFSDSTSGNLSFLHSDSIVCSISPSISFVPGCLRIFDIHCNFEDCSHICEAGSTQEAPPQTQAKTHQLGMYFWQSILYFSTFLFFLNFLYAVLTAAM